MKKVVLPGAREEVRRGLRDWHLDVVGKVVAKEQEGSGKMNWMWTDGECFPEYAASFGVSQADLPALVIVDAAGVRFVRRSQPCSPREMLGERALAGG